jgi:hypothetical protein
MTGKLVCPIGPDTKLEAEATNQEVEIWGVSVVHLDSDFKINKMEVSAWQTGVWLEFAGLGRGTAMRQNRAISSGRTELVLLSVQIQNGHLLDLRNVGDGAGVL